MSEVRSRADRARATRAAIRDAARGLFAARGYEDVAIDEIVAAAEVTKGAFYHHFTAKEALFREVFESVKQELGSAAFITHAAHIPFGGAERDDVRLRRFIEQSDSEVWDELIARCRRYVALHVDPALRRIVLEDGPALLPWHERHRIEQEHGTLLLRADLRRARHRGLIAPLPLATLAALLSGLLERACLMVAHAEDEAAARRDAMAVIARMLDGLRADAT